MAVTKNFQLYVTEPSDDPYVQEWRRKLAGTGEDSNMVKIDALLARGVPEGVRYADLSSSTVGEVYTTIQEANDAGRVVMLRYNDSLLYLIEASPTRFVFGTIFQENGERSTVVITKNSYSFETSKAIADTVTASEQRTVRGAGVATYVVEKINEAIGAFLIDES